MLCWSTGTLSVKYRWQHPEWKCSVAFATKSNSVTKSRRALCGEATYMTDVCLTVICIFEVYRYSKQFSKRTEYTSVALCVRRPPYTVFPCTTVVLYSSTEESSTYELVHDVPYEVLRSKLKPVHVCTHEPTRTIYTSCILIVGVLLCLLFYADCMRCVRGEDACYFEVYM